MFRRAATDLQKPQSPDGPGVTFLLPAALAVATSAAAGGLPANPGEVDVIAATTISTAPKSTAPLGGDGRIPVLLVSGSDTFHDWRRTTPQLRTLLEENGRFDVRVVEDTEALAVPALTLRYKTIILNGQTASSSPRLRANLARYVKRGGGLVAIHWAIDNFRSWPGFTNVLGRSWQEGESVEEHGSFHVVPIAGGTNPIIRGMQPWDTMDSEAIHYRLRGKASIDVLATARSLKTTDTATIMFAHRYGSGRTFFTPLGHSFAARTDPHWQTMMLRAVEWTATGQVTR